MNLRLMRRLGRNLFQLRQGAVEGALCLSIFLGAIAVGGSAQGQSSLESQFRRLESGFFENLESLPNPALNDPTYQVRSPVDGFGPQGFAEPIPERLPFEQEVSRLEEDYAERIRLKAPQFGRTPLRQYGYDVLGEMPRLRQVATGGAINDSYRLGIGDEVVVTFRGQANESYRTAVDREGQVFLPNMAPVPAAGLSFGQFRAELERQAAASFLRTEVFVSLGRVRNFPVLVLGQVRRPGVHRMTGVASVFDAIGAAGGVGKSGSLRHIQLIRGGHSFGVDLYDLLLTGQLDESLPLMEGDRVFVPPVGKTIGVAGDVQRPGIYEVNGRAGHMSVAEALDLAGGTLRAFGYRYMVMTSVPAGGDGLREVQDLATATVERGDMILVAKSGYAWEGAVFVDGHVSVPGPRSLRWDRSVAGVVRAPDIFDRNPYLLMAALETSDPVTRARLLVPLDLSSIVSGRSDRRFLPNDRLIVLSMEDIRFLSSAVVQGVLEGESPAALLAEEALERGFETSNGLDDATDGTRGQPDLDFAERSAFRGRDRLVDGHGVAHQVGFRAEPAGETSGFAGSDERQSDFGCSGLETLAAVVSRSRSGRYTKARLALNPETAGAVPPSAACPAIFDRYPDLLPFLLDYTVAVRGEVRVPGVYPVAPGTAAAAMVPVVGGLTPEVDLGQIELSRFSPGKGEETKAPPARKIDGNRGELAQVALQPGDILRFSPRYSDRDSGSVFLSGEVLRPGGYTIRKGERLSELIARAGGLNEQAYPEAAVFTRERVQEQEQAAYRRAALDLESGLASALASGGIQQASNANPQAVVLAVRDLAARLRQTEAVGRVVVEADPTVLDARPEFDTVLEAGDRLHIPKRPNHVTVSGEVMNPGTIQFRAGKSADSYISAAGGMKAAADDGRAFVILPDGQAQPISVSAWNYDPVQVPPGSMIVVPRNPKPFDLTAFSVTMVEIMSKLAISAASLSLLGQ